MEERNEIKVSELRQVTCTTEYEEMLKKRWERVRKQAVEGVGEWSRLRGNFVGGRGIA